MSAVTPPVGGLDDLSSESRAIATPWSRIVRGIGLGQHPAGHDPATAAMVAESSRRLEAAVGVDHPYSRFGGAMVRLMLHRTDPATADDVIGHRRLLAEVLRARSTIANPYSRVTAGSIVLDAVAKLGLDVGWVATGGDDLVAAVLADVDAIEPDAIDDENQGKHGDYERVAAWTAVCLALGRLGLADRLVSDGRDRVQEALALLPGVPTPFFRGRGGSMLLTAVAGLGDPSRVEQPLRDLLSCLDRTEEIGLYPSFPSPMTPAFVRVYPLLTTLITIGVTGQTHLTTWGRDRIQEAAELMAALEPVERTHMALYHLVALDDLGLLTESAAREVVLPVVALWDSIDPGEDYFLRGISSAYLAQLAVFGGRPDLVTDERVDAMVGAFARMSGTAQGRLHQPYPFAYTLNVLGELGVADRLHQPHAAYGDLSAFDWLVDRLAEDSAQVSPRLYMLDHALISAALRTRPRGPADLPAPRPTRALSGR